MFFETETNNHGLAHNPFKAVVAPRPIGWISSRDDEGRVNLAPYSFFNGVNSVPPIVMFASVGRKDTLANVESTREFVCNLATYDLREAVNGSSAPLPPGISEFEATGLTEAPCNLIDVPRVKESPVALECRYIQTIEVLALGGERTGTLMAFGQVVGIHIDDSVIRDGRVDVTLLKPLSRLGYMDFAAIDEVFEMVRPKGG